MRVLLWHQYFTNVLSLYNLNIIEKEGQKKNNKTDRMTDRHRKSAIYITQQ